jgi:uncharacterized membrane protein YfcA
VSPLELGAASAVIALGALVQGAVGFGSLLIAAPLLVLIDAKLVPGPILVSGLLLALLMAYRERRGLEVRGVGWAFAGRVPGSVVGALILAAVPPEGFDLLVGATVLLGVLASLARVEITPSPAALFSAGFVAGITGTTTSVGGPPVALVYQHESGERLRGALAGFFVMGSVLSMLTLACVGRFGGRELLAGLVLVPGTLAGYAASGPLARFVDRGYTRAAVLGVSAAAGLVLILRRFV